MSQSFVEMWNTRREATTPANKEQLRMPHGPDNDIRSVLGSYGIKKENIEDHGHVLVFNYEGLVVRVIDQDTRLIGHMHRKPASELEKECLQDRDSILKSDAYTVEEKEKFLREFNYRAFVFNGRPAEAIHDVMELSKTPIEEVLRLYRIGNESSVSNTYGPIHGVATTLARAMRPSSTQYPKSN